MPPSCDTPTQGRSTTKKALLIGIGYHEPGGEWGPVATSIPDAKKFATFLRNRGYTSIVEMTDEDGVEERYRPTKANLKREMKAFGRGVEPGDHLVFYFSGHSDQVPCRTNSEEDAMDEVLVAADGHRIRDNTLYSLLVEGLPKGSALTAIFDSCNSGTLLDLPHYGCNRVYRPWLIRGLRRSHTLRNNVVRKNHGFGPPSRKGTRSGSLNRSRSTEGGSEAGDYFPTLFQLMQTDGRPTTVPAPFVIDPDKHYGERSASPECQFECDGWCRKAMPKMTPEHPDVICISSPNDAQVLWEAGTLNGNSISMTTFLIVILGKYPQITFAELMTRLNHAVHSFRGKMHDAVERERRARRVAGGMNPGSEDSDWEEEFVGEMNTFQDLELGSMTPVDMDRLFTL